MKKVGIATFTGALPLNYGSTLQTVALQKLIAEQGFNSCSCTLSNWIDKSRGHGLRRVINNTRRLGWKYLSTLIKFLLFFRKMKAHLSPHFSEFASKSEAAEYAKKHFDILCVGSDAIWRKRWLKDFFLWDYPELKDKPVFSYAPSVNNGEITYGNFGVVLDRYKAISVRETPAKDYVQEHIAKDVQVVLDPTLAVDEELWHRASTGRLIKDNYILVYIIERPDKYRITIEDVAKRYGSKIVYINTDFIDKSSIEYNLYHDDDYTGIVGPAQFLSLIKYSDAVVTDSFHGSCFSVVFRKDFYVIPRAILDLSKNDNRISDLTERLEIGDRYIKNNTQILKMPGIEWNITEKALEKERMNSKYFIKMALDACTERE